jgi:hypothetical protein
LLSAGRKEGRKEEKKIARERKTERKEDTKVEYGRRGQEVARMKGERKN